RPMAMRKLVTPTFACLPPTCCWEKAADLKSRKDVLVRDASITVCVVSAWPSARWKPCASGFEPAWHLAGLYPIKGPSAPISLIRMEIEQARLLTLHAA